MGRINANLQQILDLTLLALDSTFPKHIKDMLDPTFRTNVEDFYN